MLSWNRELDPRVLPLDPGRLGGESFFPIGGDGIGSANGLASVTGMRAGPDRIIGTPLTGRIGLPSAKGSSPRLKGSEDCEYWLMVLSRGSEYPSPPV